MTVDLGLGVPSWTLPVERLVSSTTRRWYCVVVVATRRLPDAAVAGRDFHHLPPVDAEFGDPRRAVCEAVPAGRGQNAGAGGPSASAATRWAGSRRT